MAIAIYEDLVSQTSYSEDDRTGQFDRPYVVTGLTPGNRISIDALFAADGNRSIPRPGQQHPAMPAYRVQSVTIHPFANSRNTVRLLVRYIKRDRQLLDLQINTVPLNTETDRDKDGKLLIVGYKPPATLGGESQAATTKVPYPPTPRNGFQYDYARVPFFLCELQLAIEYREHGSPFTQMAGYTQTLNQIDWQGRGPRRWFCEGYSARIDTPIPTNLDALGNPTVVTGPAVFDWIVRRNFRLIAAPPTGPGWDPLILYYDRAVGLSPTDIDPVAGGYLAGKTIGNGWRVVQLYAESDFNELDLVSAIEIPEPPRRTIQVI